MLINFFTFLNSELFFIPDNFENWVEQRDLTMWSIFVVNFLSCYLEELKIKNGFFKTQRKCYIQIWLFRYLVLGCQIQIVKRIFIALTKNKSLFGYGISKIFVEWWVNNTFLLIFQFLITIQKRINEIYGPIIL